MGDNGVLIFIGIVWLIGGTISLLGAIKKWKIIIDPNEKYWWLYAPSWQKKVLGKDAMIPLNFWSGIIAIIGGIVMVFFGMKNIFFNSSLL